MGATHQFNRMGKRMLGLGMRENYERKAMYV